MDSADMKPVGILAAELEMEITTGNNRTFTANERNEHLRMVAEEGANQALSKYMEEEDEGNLGEPMVKMRKRTSTR